jgi:hypothetical protein
VERVKKSFLLLSIREKIVSTIVMKKSIVFLCLFLLLQCSKSNTTTNNSTSDIDSIVYYTICVVMPNDTDGNFCFNYITLKHPILWSQIYSSSEIYNDSSLVFPDSTIIKLIYCQHFTLTDKMYDSCISACTLSVVNDTTIYLKGKQ